MRTRSPVPCHGIGPIVLTILELLAIIGVPISRAVPQTAATGALIGGVLDPTGKGIPGASVELKNQDMATSRSTVSDEEGRFVFTLLPPGTYQVTAQKDGYSQAQSSVTVSVTETARLSIPLKIAGLTQSVQVHADWSGVQTDSAALGRIVDGDMVTNLPLVTRNYTPREGSSLEFRAEFFNTLNHPQFANPDANFSSATFGVITLGQLGLKFSF